MEPAPWFWLSLIFTLASNTEASKHMASIVAQVGEDGTDDSVTAQICSAYDVCCKTPKLEEWYSNDWSKNDEEEWAGEKYLGAWCTALDLGEGEAITVTLFKGGLDSLGVEDLKIMTDGGLWYACGSFNLGANEYQTEMCELEG